jgi:ABC-type multidrug transport system fused ATPase/permease subunit
MSGTAAPAATKPEPLLHASMPSMLQRVRDLAWLLAQMYRSAPRHGAIWALSAVLVGSLAPLQLWAGGRLVDSIQAGYEGRTATSPWVWLAVVAGALVGVRFLDSIRFYVDAVVRERSGPAIQARVYEQVTGIDLAAYEHQPFYDTTGRITAEVDRTATDILNTFQDTLVSVPRLIGAVILLVAIDWRIALVAVLPILPSLAVFFRSGKHIWSILTDQTRDRRIATYLAGRMADRQAAKEIRLFGIQRFLLDRWSHHFLTTRDALRRQRFWAMLRVQIVANGLFLVSAVLFLWLVLGGTVRVSTGDVTVLMASFMSLGNWLFSAVIGMQRLGESSGLASDTRAFLGLPTPHAAAATADDAPQTAPAASRIEVVDLRFAYPGARRPVLDAVSLTIPPGQRVAIVGENGAGKTTLLKLILGLYQPDEGAVHLGGTPVHELPAAERQRRMAAVFQHFTRYPLTVRENVTLNRDSGRGRPAIDDVLAMAGLDRSVRELPAGSDTVLAPDLGGVDLSGGQWQRLAIARAGWRNAAVLALDEPTAALDPMAEVAIFRRFAALAEGRTTLLVSHRLGMARLADRILVLERGRIVEDGTHNELLTVGGRYAAMWRMQARWYQ